MIGAACLTAALLAVAPVRSQEPTVRIQDAAKIHPKVTEVQPPPPEPPPPPDCKGSPALWWTTQKVKTSQFSTCMSIAYKAISDVGLSDIRKSQVDVAGRTANSHAFITCLNTTNNGLVAFVTVAGQDPESKNLRAQLAEKIANLVPID